MYLAKRTTKYLQCILGHKPIVSFEWITHIARIVDYHLSEEKAIRHTRVLTVNVGVHEFPSWVPYLIKGDTQATNLILGGPERALHSSLVILLPDNDA